MAEAVDANPDELTPTSEDLIYNTDGKIDYGGLLARRAGPRLMYEWAWLGRWVRISTEWVMALGMNWAGFDEMNTWEYWNLFNFLTDACDSSKDPESASRYTELRYRLAAWNFSNINPLIHCLNCAGDLSIISLEDADAVDNSLMQDNPSDGRDVLIELDMKPEIDPESDLLNHQYILACAAKLEIHPWLCHELLQIMQEKVVSPKYSLILRSGTSSLVLGERYPAEFGSQSRKRLNPLIIASIRSDDYNWYVKWKLEDENRRLPLHIDDSDYALKAFDRICYAAFDTWLHRHRTKHHTELTAALMGTFEDPREESDNAWAVLRRYIRDLRFGNSNLRRWHRERRSRLQDTLLGESDGAVIKSTMEVSSEVQSREEGSIHSVAVESAREASPEGRSREEGSNRGVVDSMREPSPQMSSGKEGINRSVANDTRGQEQQDSLRARFEANMNHALEEAKLCTELLELRNSERALLASERGLLAANLSIAEAHSVGRITLLAYVFLPLILVTGVFGMNLSSIDGIAMWKFWVTTWAIVLPAWGLGLWTIRTQIQDFVKKREILSTLAAISASVKEAPGGLKDSVTTMAKAMAKRKGREKRDSGV